MGVCYNRLMVEREPRKEVIERGELYFLWHPMTSDIFSGYGLTMQEGRKDHLVGVLMVDRPRPVDPQWLEVIKQVCGNYELVPMTMDGDRGIICQMYVAQESLLCLKQFESPQSAAIQQALSPLLEEHPNPTFGVLWDPELGLWRSCFRPEDILTDREYEVWQRAQAGELSCPRCLDVPLSGKIVLDEDQEGQIEGLLLYCPKCGFREY